MAQTTLPALPPMNRSNLLPTRSPILKAASPLSGVAGGTPWLSAHPSIGATLPPTASGVPTQPSNAASFGGGSDVLRLRQLPVSSMPKGINVNQISDYR